jgi:hypothetical protein
MTLKIKTCLMDNLPCFGCPFRRIQAAIHTILKKSGLKKYLRIQGGNFGPGVNAQGQGRRYFQSGQGG